LVDRPVTGNLRCVTKNLEVREYRLMLGMGSHIPHPLPVGPWLGMMKVLPGCKSFHQVQRRIERDYRGPGRLGCCQATVGIKKISVLLVLGLVLDRTRHRVRPGKGAKLRPG